MRNIKLFSINRCQNRCAFNSIFKFRGKYSIIKEKLEEKGLIMRKIFTIIIATMILGMFTGCSYLKKAEARKNAAKLNDIRVTFVTTQGEVNFFLYPEAAPVTVANFINLGKRGFYNENKIHRAVDGFIVQAGDPTETGEGGPGYRIPDEIVDWLDFYQQGMLAMANAGPGTGGSQYFFTMYPADWLNKKHTVFGEVVSDADFNTIRKLEVGDVIREVKFSGPADFFLSLHKDQIEQWNAVLDEKFPDLPKYEIRDPEEFGEQVLQYREELERIYTPQEKDEETRKEYFIPRTIRGIEKKIKARKAAKSGAEVSEVSAEATEVTPAPAPMQLMEMEGTEATEPVQQTEIEEVTAPEEAPQVEEVPAATELPEVEEAAEITDSPDKVEVEPATDDLGEIESLEDLDETNKGFWDRMKFWQKDEKKVKEIG